MEYHLGPRHSCPRRIWVHHVALHQAGCGIHIVQMATADVDQDQHVVTPGYQCINEVGTNKSCPTGNHNVHSPIPPMRARSAPAGSTLGGLRTDFASSRCSCCRAGPQPGGPER